MSSLFRPALDLLVQYAGYHRDRRNIATHFVGIPMIVFAVGVLLARGTLTIGGVATTAAWVLFALAALWYVTRGRPAIGLATAAGIAALMWLAHRVSDGSVANWLGWGVSFFIAGWIAQFIGHYYEGRKPAFADDLVGLLVGPMFVTLELLALAGYFRGLAEEIERRAGPTTLRDLAHPVTR